MSLRALCGCICHVSDPWVIENVFSGRDRIATRWRWCRFGLHFFCKGEAAHHPVFGSEKKRRLD